MRPQLTARQKQVYDFLVDKARTGDVTPSLREIGLRFRIASTNGVARHLEALRKKGYIQMDRGKARAIRIVDRVKARSARAPASEVERRTIPLLGRVAAGLGLLAEENREGDIVIDPDLFGSSDAFALRVKGDSMIEDGIHEGDLVLVQPQRYASNGDVVVALLNDEATVKRYFARTNHLELRPANPAYQTIVVPKGAENFLLVGKVIGLMRRY